MASKYVRILYGAQFYRGSNNTDIASRKTDVFLASAMYSQCTILSQYVISLTDRESPLSLLQTANDSRSVLLLEGTNALY